MKKKITVLAASLAVMAMSLPALAAPPAGAGSPGMPAGIQCQMDGIGFLQSAGLLPAVAKNGVVVTIGGGDETALDFRTVLALHRSNPELFQTGTPVEIVEVGGIRLEAGLQPTWCD
jgi:hypothetical protein